MTLEARLDPAHRNAPIPQVGVFARIPRPGAGKTRLAAAVGEPRAAALAAAVLADTLDRVARLAPARTWWWLAPESGPNAAALVAEARQLVAVPAAVRLEVQRGAHLGERMDDALAAMRARGPALVLGADVPDLPAAILAEAIEHVRAGGPADVVIGPAQDGGFYLLGSSGPLGELLRGRAAWGDGGVYARTLADAERGGLAVHALARWGDVDDAEDLTALRERLLVGRAAGDAARPGWPARTAAMLLDP